MIFTSKNKTIYTLVYLVFSLRSQVRPVGVLKLRAGGGERAIKGFRKRTAGQVNNL